MTPRDVPRIPNDQLREAFLASDITPYELAQRVEWWRSNGKLGADSTRVQRVLGLKDFTKVRNGRRERFFNKTISEVDALAIGQALGLDPFEIGL